MHRGLAIVARSLALSLLGLVLASPACERGLERLRPGRGSAGSESVLPEGTVVLHAGDARDVTPPFVLREDASSADGSALVVPEGAGTPERQGRAKLWITVPAAGTYYVWARVLWSDACGNSLSLFVGDGPELAVGQDAVYGTWHWVPAGPCELPAGQQCITIVEREDGISLDQLLVTPDKDFFPVGPATPAPGEGVRRFADDFSRSPGHGMEGWRLVSGEWHIAFSFDPNRIPYQYTLMSGPSEVESVALVDGPPWKGCRLSFSLLPVRDGRFGAMLDHSVDGRSALRLEVQLSDGRAALIVTGSGIDARRDLGDAVRQGQWHRLVVERWAWVVRVLLDDQLVFASCQAAPSAGAVGLFVSAGEVAFDDVAVDEIPWQGDDGGLLRMPWAVGDGARWFRPTRKAAPAALVGRRGAIAARMPAPIEEVLVEQMPDSAVTCGVEASGLELRERAGNVRLFAWSPSAGEPASTVCLTAANGETRIRRVAIRTGTQLPQPYRVGPYHFSETDIEDASDYLDFTPEEYEQIARSPDADKLLRQARLRPLVSNDADISVWVREAGRWEVAGGVLQGRGPRAALRHSQQIGCEMELRMRLRLEADSAAEVELYGGVERGLSVRVGAAAEGCTLCLGGADDGQWHEVVIQSKDDRLLGRLDGGPFQSAPIERGVGETVRLLVPAGRAEFDDVEFLIPRRAADAFFYAFDRAETDWWREGGQWVDHGGIACVLASNWISLVAPRAQGVLWNKRALGPDLTVAFDVEENTEWFGWTRGSSHVHYPFDNICVLLMEDGRADHGYRVELNAQKRSATVLYRNGEEVARVAQRGSFPMRYRGGHAPYAPRRNRISVLERGGQLAVIVNSRPVLQFTDPEPLKVGRVGIGGYDTRVNFTHVEIRGLHPSSAAPSNPGGAGGG